MPQEDKHTAGEWAMVHATYRTAEDFAQPAHGFDIVVADALSNKNISIKMVCNIIPVNDEGITCNTIFSLEESEANAMLIAASPELLEQVRLLQYRLEMLINATASGKFRNQLCDENLKAMDVIRKATKRY